jgi:hypothetical protein
MNCLMEELDVLQATVSKSLTMIDSTVGVEPREDRVRSGEAAGSEGRFSAYVERLSTALGHRDREGPF